MNKTQLAELMARLTIITGSLTNWQSNKTRFGKGKSQWQLSRVFEEEYRLCELYRRLEELINELDNDTQFCIVLENQVKILS